MRTLLTSLSLPLLLAVTVPACSSAPIEGDSSSTAGSTHDAWTETLHTTWGTTSVDDFIGALHPEQIQIQVRDGAGTIVPSAAINNLLPPDPSGNVVTFSVPGFHHDYGTAAPTVDATVSNLDVANVAVSLTSSAVVASFDLSGKVFVHESGLYPNFDVIIAPSTFTISLSFHSGILSVDSVTGSLDMSVHDCGVAGWCDSFAADFVPDFSGKVDAGLRAAVNKALLKPSTKDAIDATLLAFSGHKTDLPPFHVVPGSASIDSAGVEFKIAHDLPPTTPTHPSATVLCGDDVDITWDANPDSIRILRTDPDGTLTEVSYDGVNAPSERHDYKPPGATASYQVCAYSYLGQLCAPAFTVKIPHTSCGGTGGGGTSKTGCTKNSKGKLICYSTGD